VHTGISDIRSVLCFLLAVTVHTLGEEHPHPEAQDRQLAPVGDYTLYQLVLEDATLKDEMGGMVAYPFLANLHCINGKIVSGWLDGRKSELQKYRREGPSMVLPENLHIRDGRIHGVLSIVSCWNRYDFRIDGDVKNGTIDGFYEKAYGGGPQGEKQVRGEISIPNHDLTGEEHRYRLRLNGIMAGKDLAVTVSVKDSGIEAYCRGDPGDPYNTGAHRILGSDLSKQGSVLSGEVFLMLASDGYLPPDWRPIGIRCSIEADTSRPEQSGTYSAVIGVEHSVYGRVRGMVVAGKERVLREGRVAPGTDYAWFRGPKGSGAAVDRGHALVDSARKAKLRWRSEEHVLFKWLSARGWAVPRGHGTYVGPLVADGRVYQYAFLPDPDSHPVQADDWMVCMDAATGLTLWLTSFRHSGANYQCGKYGNGHNVPCIRDGRVYFMGSAGQVFCLDARTGEYVWRSDVGTSAYLIEEHKAAQMKRIDGKTEFKTVSGFHHGTIVADGVMVCGGGGLKAFDAATGRYLWSGSCSGWGSPLLWRYGGRELIVSSNGTCLDPKTGKVLWRTDRTSYRCTLALGELDGKHYLFAPGGEIDDEPVSAKCYEITPDACKLVWKLNPLESSGALPSPLIYRDCVYFPRSLSFRCIDLRTGKLMVKLSSRRPVASPIAAEGKVFHQGMFAAGPHGFRKLGRSFEIPEAICCTPSFADGRYFGRGNDGIYCYDFRRDAEARPGLEVAAVRVPYKRKAPPAQLELRKSTFQAIRPSADPRPVRTSLVTMTNQVELKQAFVARWGQPFELGHDPAALVRQLRSDYLSERQRAVEELARIDARARQDMLPALAKLLNHGPFHVMRSALDALRITGPAKQAAGHVYAALKRSVAAGRPHAAELLWDALMDIKPEMREPAAKDVAALVPSPDQRVMIAACTVLGKTGADRSTVVPALATALSEGDLEVAVAAAKALERYGPAPKAVPALAQRLEKDAYVMLVRPCILALRANGEDARPAIPALKGVMAQRRYGRFGDALIAREIMTTLRGMGDTGSKAIASMMAESGSGAGKAFSQATAEEIPHLRELLRHENIRTVVQAARTLGKMGGTARSTVPALIQILNRNGVEEEAAAALLRIGRGGETLAMTRLLGMAGNRKEKELEDFAGLLSGLIRSTRGRDDLGRALTKALLAVAKGGHARAEARAIEALGELGPVASEAIPYLKQYVGTDSEFAVIALKALDEIER